MSSCTSTIIVGTVMTSITVFILLLILVPPLRLLLWGKALSSVVYLLPTIIIWLALRMLGMLAIDGAFRVKHVTLFAYQDATMLVVNMVHSTYCNRLCSVLTPLPFPLQIVGIFIVLKRLLLLTFFLMFRCDCAPHTPGTTTTTTHSRTAAPSQLLASGPRRWLYRAL